MAESALIEELLRQYGENPRRVFARLANEYRKQGDLTTAIEICRTQVPLQPTYISGYIVLGQALFESGQLDEARATFEAAIGFDPENLIALRQLGDVARLTGDLEGARGWYYRLLEVDPQNVDVAVHLKVLETSTAAPAPAPGTTEPVSWSDINPERPGAPGLNFPAMPRLTLGTIPENLTPDTAPAASAGPGAAGGAGSPGAAAVTPPPPPHFAGLEDFAQFTAPIAPPPSVASPAPSSTASPAGAAPRRDPALPDIAAFQTPTPPRGSLGVPSTPAPNARAAETVAMPRPSMAAPAAPMPRPSQPTSSNQPSPSSPVEEEEPALWSPPAPVGRPQPQPQPQPQTQSAPAEDSLRDTMSFPTPRNVEASKEAAAAPPPPPARPAAIDPRSGVDSWGSIPESHGALAAPIGGEAPYDPTIGRMLDLSGGPTGEVPAAFMTETMAELYLQQGYHEEALRIYRQLAASRPEDASLRERIARLERGARSSVSMAASVSEEVIIAARDRASRPTQTIRNLFSGLASRRPPVAATAAPMSPPAHAAPPTGGSPAAGPISAPMAPEPKGASPAASETPAALNGAAPGGLGGLFADRVPAPDQQAAVALAGAFSEDFTGGKRTPAAGQPARAASLPLSLDDVFRDQKAPTDERTMAASVSFDEFFAPPESGAALTVKSATPPSVAQSGGAPPEADLALFHEWLDGLKK